MKKMILMCLLVFTAISVDAQDKTSKKDKKNKKEVTTEVSTTQTVVIKTNIYCSHFMQCGGGAPRVQTGLSAVAGVSAVVIDDKAMTITVTYNSQKTNPDAIRLAISKMGFDADDVKADPAAYEKLDGCCKKH